MPVACLTTTSRSAFLLHKLFDSSCGSNNASASYSSISTACYNAIAMNFGLCILGLLFYGVCFTATNPYR